MNRSIQRVLNIVDPIEHGTRGGINEQLLPNRVGRTAVAVDDIHLVGQPILAGHALQQAHRIDDEATRLDHGIGAGVELARHRLGGGRDLGG